MHVPPPLVYFRRRYLVFFVGKVAERKKRGAFHMERSKEAGLREVFNCVPRRAFYDESQKKRGKIRVLRLGARLKSLFENMPQHGLRRLLSKNGEPRTAHAIGQEILDSRLVVILQFGKIFAYKFRALKFAFCHEQEDEGRGRDGFCD